jgi:diguanylate cyclase (GGDEF)-like protein/PAS domain S-box-containing protein
VNLSLDNHTLAIVVALISSMQAFVLLVQHWLYKGYSGPGWWVLGSAAWALGYVVNSLLVNSAIYQPVGSIVITALLTISLALFYVGVMRFFGKHEHSGWIIFFCMMTPLIAFFFTYIVENAFLRRLNFSVALAVLSYIIAWRLLKFKIQSIAGSIHFLAAIFLVSGSFFTLRVLSLLLDTNLENQLTISLTQTLTYVAALLFSASWTQGFIILINQRLNADNREARDNLETIFNTIPDAVLVTRLANGAFVAINDGFTALTGFTRQDILGKSTLDVHLWQNPSDRQRLVSALEHNGFSNDLEVHFQRKDGSSFLGLTSAKIISLQNEPHIISVTHDITQQRLAEEEKKKTDAWLRTLSVAITQTPVTTVITDLNGTIVYVNPRFTETTGYTAEEALGQNPRILKSGEMPASNYKAMWDTITSGKNWKGIFHNKKKNGQLYWESAIISPVIDENGEITHFMAMKEDITERKRLEEELQKQSTIDELTGAYNRRQFYNLANTEIKRSKRLRHPLSMALIDIDYFKSVNDTYGHAAGDRVLVSFAHTCQQNIRDIDMLSRIGGDEFVIILPETASDQAYIALERLRQELASRPIDYNETAIPITISCGIASLAGKTESLDQLMERADQALYQAKQAGRNCVSVN